MDVQAATVIRFDDNEPVEVLAAELNAALAAVRADHPAVASAEAVALPGDRLRITIEFVNIGDEIDDLEDWCREILGDALARMTETVEYRGSLSLVSA